MVFLIGGALFSIVGLIVLFFDSLTGIGLILFGIAMMILISGFERLAPSDQTDENQIKQQEMDKFSELQRRANQQKQIEQIEKRLGEILSAIEKRR